MTENWIPASQPPELHDREYILGALYSDRILIANYTGATFTGWAWRWEESDFMDDCRIRWTMAGPDGYDIVDVRYWMPIPKLPEDIRS